MTISLLGSDVPIDPKGDGRLVGGGMGRSGCLIRRPTVSISLSWPSLRSRPQLSVCNFILQEAPHEDFRGDQSSELHVAASPDAVDPACGSVTCLFTLWAG